MIDGVGVGMTPFNHGKSLGQMLCDRYMVRYGLYWSVLGARDWCGTGVCEGYVWYAGVRSIGAYDVI